MEDFPPNNINMKQIRPYNPPYKNITYINMMITKGMGGGISHRVFRIKNKIYDTNLPLTAKVGI